MMIFVAAIYPSHKLRLVTCKFICNLSPCAVAAWIQIRFWLMRHVAETKCHSTHVPHAMCTFDRSQREVDAASRSQLKQDFHTALEESLRSQSLKGNANLTTSGVSIIEGGTKLALTGRSCCPLYYSYLLTFSRSVWMLLSIWIDFCFKSWQIMQIDLPTGGVSDICRKGLKRFNSGYHKI